MASKTFHLYARHITFNCINNLFLQDKMHYLTYWACQCNKVYLGVRVYNNDYSNFKISYLNVYIKRSDLQAFLSTMFWNRSWLSFYQQLKLNRLIIFAGEIKYNLIEICPIKILLLMNNDKNVWQIITS